MEDIMKNIKRILSVLVIAVLAVTMAVSAYAAAPEAGTKYECDLSLEAASTDRFFITAISKADGTQMEIDPEAKATWSADWPGHWVVAPEGVELGKEDYVSYKSEKVAGKLDHMCHGNYMSVFAFKVPADGKYDIYYNATKYSVVDGSLLDFTLTKKGAAEALATQTAVTGGDIIFDVKGVELAEGDEIWIIATTNEANTVAAHSNTVVNNFDVTFVEAVEIEEPTPTPDPEPTPDPAPETSDNLALTVGVLALAAAGVVIASKKRR